MSTLLIDLGNTRLKWALYAPGRWQTGAVVHAGSDMAPVLDAALGALAVPRAVLAASVAGPARWAALDGWVRARWGLPPRALRAPARQLGVINRYHEPAALGADRWAALLGARALTAGPACVVDCGTAVTVDALSGDGEFLGGIIFPGLGLLRTSLAGTGSIGLQPGADGSCLARSTADAVAAGTLFGLAGAITRALDEQRAVLGADAATFLTGGDAAVIAARLHADAAVQPDLVLRGLARIADSL